MASLSLREGVQEHLLLERPILQGHLVKDFSDSCLDRNEGYSIKYAYNSHETYWLNGKKFHLAPGESLFINLKYSKAYHFEASKLSRGLCVYYQEEELQDLFQVLKQQKIIDYNFSAFEQIPELRFERGAHLNQKLKSICSDLQDDLHKIDLAGFESILEEMLMEIDWEIIGYNRRLKEFNPSTRQALIRKVMAARKFMINNLHKALKLEDIAKEVAMSPFHFQRQYKKATGNSPTRHLVEWRIARAKELLEEDQHSVLEISTMLAYNDLPTFSKAFKREVGCSPSQWTKKNEVLSV